jgi:tripartite-type tricarboxylate transporter receptor subunit TctC
VPAGNFAELVALARARPGELNYGSSGNGSIHHLAMEALKAALEPGHRARPLQGYGPGGAGPAGGQVSLLFSSPPSIAAYIRAGRLKVFAVSTAARSPEAPAVPAIAELGVPGFNFVPEIGVVAPAATPAAIVQQLSGGIARAVRDADNAQRFAQLSIVPAGSAPEVYARMIRSAYDRYGRIVKISGAVPNEYEIPGTQAEEAAWHLE